jgi:hypothetical protein
MTATIRTAWALAAGAHLALVAVGAAGAEFAGAGAVPSVLAHYGHLTGADNTYGFFAPSVSSQCRVSFTMRDAAGGTWRDELVGGEESALSFRSQSAVDAIGKLPDDLRRALSASWAGTMFARHPRAQYVVVEVEVEELPTMSAWRDGARQQWAPLYRATFVRKEVGDAQLGRR